MKQRSNEVKTEAVAIAPNWELLVHIPAVFVRVANTRLTGYGTWKSIRKMGDEAAAEIPQRGRAEGRKDLLAITGPLPHPACFS
jgi:hypothetical protein